MLLPWSKVCRCHTFQILFWYRISSFIISENVDLAAITISKPKQKFIVTEVFLGDLPGPIWWLHCVRGLMFLSLVAQPCICVGFIFKIQDGCLPPQGGSGQQGGEIKDERQSFFRDYIISLVSHWSKLSLRLLLAAREAGKYQCYSRCHMSVQTWGCQAK